ncbi:hypothetical protein L873DRAFT_1432099 [Choiromyces venosus 120613-1]|uniref:Uncharacterized protein n=1 Tax=Choiromyces venosus 120613-1 TaxID=1336337 RepID=A0A3N4J7X6_9PEZI|nr:hypothetical protein L873DRAFT_1432099 [Choiromyces venosus 120613-1]
MPAGEEIWLGDIVKFKDSCQRDDVTWGICCGQLDVIEDGITTPYLRVSLLKEIDKQVLLFSPQLNQQRASKELKSVHSICGYYYATCIYPPPKGCQTIVVTSEDMEHNGKPSEPQYEIMTQAEITHFFPPHPVKLTREGISLSSGITENIPIHQYNVTLWQDGLSGNRTKKWNLHECTLLSFPSSVKQVIFAFLFS